MKFHDLLNLLLILVCVGFGPVVAARDLPVTWGDDVWQLQTDPTSGALVRMENKEDPRHMNWLREPGHWNRRDWVADASPEAVTLDGQWGLVETTHTGLLHVGRSRQLSDRVWESIYTSSALTVTVRRELVSNGELSESYTFKNTGNVTLDLPLGSVAITAPLFDQYPDSKLSLTARCHAHLWMGGSSAWINATRMGTEAPHLGLVVTQGSLDAYSQRGATFNDRGVFTIHPSAMKIEKGQGVTLAWKLFWHQGWDDFFSKLGATKDFVRLTAKDYTVTAGDALEITAESASPLESAELRANGVPVKVQARGGHLRATIPTSKSGEVLVELRNNSRKSRLRANVVPALDDLLDARVKFIVRKQQRRREGDPLDGAYLTFDNETGLQVHDTTWPDHNAGRERLAMGTLGALYLLRCRDEAFKTELKESLARHATFVARELENDQGMVFDGIGRKGTHRLYNFPWVAHFHLAMYRAVGDSGHLDRYVRVVRSHYAKNAAHYSIGMPITGGLNALAEARRKQERDELLACFKAHADHILKEGTAYPRSEVNFEQAIVAPAVQILGEVYAATGDIRYLEGAKQQMPLLEAFCGKQPDHRLHEVALRHWDDYWFGKRKIYGDTLPHYWSTLNAVAYAWHGRGLNDPSWLQRAEAVANANLSLFNPDGSATCAHLFPLTINGEPAARNDPWANDQDWALVNLLTVRALVKPAAAE